MTLTPAYGRDYTSKATVLEDFLAGKDFLHQPSDQLINRPQIEELGLATVNVRYVRLTRLVVLEKDGDTWKAQ